jgi:tRNA modification GTPase
MPRSICQPRRATEWSRHLLERAGWHASGVSLFIARERHLVALRQAAEHLHAAAGQTGSAELLAEELRLAQAALNAVTGEFTADDLLGEIFARFCIGK